MKILITNPDALIDASTGNFFDGIEKVLEEFNSVDGQQTIVVSVDGTKLKPIPKSFEPLHINGKARGGRILIDTLQVEILMNVTTPFRRKLTTHSGRN